MKKCQLTKDYFQEPHRSEPGAISPVMIVVERLVFGRAIGQKLGTERVANQRTSK